MIEQEFDELLESVDFEYYLIPEFSDSLLFDYSCVTMHYHPVDITLTTSWVISTGNSTKLGLWTGPWTGLWIQLPRVRSHAKLISSEVLM